MQACRQCGSNSVQDRGRLRDDRRFAGIVLPKPLYGGRLFECLECKLCFRSPVLSEAEYEALYRSGPDGVWPTSGERLDQLIARGAIQKRIAEGQVLDVGCYDGAFLESLGPRYAKFGVEASLAACASAKERGIAILAGAINDLGRVNQKFDAVVALDVAEHVANPLAFLGSMAERTKPGGMIVVGSGDADAIAWRRLGAMYWYCANAEHISFIGQRWCQAAAESLALELAECHVGLPHGIPGSVARKWDDWAVLGAKVIVNGIWPKHPRLAAGSVGKFRDHLLAVFVKPN